MNFQHIQAIRELNAQRRHNASLLHAGSGSQSETLIQRVQSQYRDEEQVFEKLVRNGYDSLTFNDQKMLRNAMSTTTGSQGGYVVPTTMAVNVVDALKQYSSIRRLASSVITATGENRSYASSDGRSELGEQIDQNTSASSLDPTFGQTPLNTFKYSSKVITVPMELLQDSSVDIVGFLTNRVAARIGRITNNKFTVGAGTTEPMGVVTAATVGKVGAAGQTATVTDDDLEDLIGSVDAAYRESAQCGWTMHESTLRKISKLKDSNGQPLKLVKEGSRALGTPTTLKGYPVEINPDMPVMAANAKSILFGDFSGYMVRDVASMFILRLEDSAFASKGQIGFLGLARAGGANVDVGGGIKAYQNSAS